VVEYSELSNLRIGAKLPNSGPLPLTFGIPAMARRLEEAGFGSLWVSDHIVLPTSIDSRYPFAEDGRATWPSDAPYIDALVALGYMRAEGRLFRLSPRVLELGRPYLSSLTLPEIALPHLRDFVAEVRESSSLAILDGSDIVYVAHVAAKRIMSVSVSVGTRDPAFATSLGRALLAGQSDEWLSASLAGLELEPITDSTIVDPGALLSELRRIRKQGWALVDQELEEGLRALAAPIHDEHGHVIAAANVAVHASRWTLDAIRGDLLPRLLEVTAAIDGDLLATGVPAGKPHPAVR
jgi:IclR family pca regulon transcriptional regulator